jgi:hypothetical protein
MRDQSISIATGRLVIGCDAGAERAWIELPTEPAVTVHLREGELLMTIEALAMTYAELRGARPDSAAYGVKRTLRNCTNHRRERERP